MSLCLIQRILLRFYDNYKGFKMKNSLYFLALLAISNLTGCASITSSAMQPVAVTAKDTEGNQLSQVDCSLRNEKGQWTVTAPNTVHVHKDSADLKVECNKPGQPVGKLRAISRAGAGMYGNILIGGGIGAVVDHTSGKAYNYPNNLPVVMGKVIVIDRRSSNNSVSSTENTTSTTN